MKKLGRNTLALGMSTLLVTSAVALSANAAEEPVAQANSSASTGTGLFSTLQLDTGTCEAIFPNGEQTGLCGPELDTNAIDTFIQEAEANADGTSAAEASVAGVDLTSLETALNLSDLIADIQAVQPRTIVGTVLSGLGGLLGLLDGETPIIGGILNPTQPPTDEEVENAIVAAVDGVLGQVLGAVDGAIPVTLELGAVNAQCTANPTAAQGSSFVGDIDLVLQLPAAPGSEAPTTVRVPVLTGTSANANLLVNAPNELLDGVFDGLRASLEESLNGALSPINGGLTALEDGLVDPLFDALEPQLLQALADAIEDLVSGTVNAQSVSEDGRSIEVSALQLRLLGAENQLDLGRVSCGPNAGPTAVDDQAAAAGDDNNEADAQADGTIADAQADAQADAIADADAQADADVTTSLPNAGAPNLLPFWLLGLGLVAFGAAVLVNERRRALI